MEKGISFSEVPDLRFHCFAERRLTTDWVHIPSASYKRYIVKDDYLASTNVWTLYSNRTEWNADSFVFQEP